MIRVSVLTCCLVLSNLAVAHSRVDYFLWLGWIDRSIWNSLEPNQQTYLNDRIVEISSMTDKLSDLTTQLKNMSDESRVERYQGIELKELLRLIRSFQNEDHALDIKIGELSYIFSKLNSSKHDQINLDFVTDFFRSAKNELIKQSEILTFIVRQPNNQVIIHQSLCTETLLKKIRHSAHQRKEIRDNVSRLRDWSNGDLNQVQSAFQNLFSKLIDSQVLDNFFMIRSYLRALYQLRLGEIVNTTESKLISLDTNEERMIGNSLVNLTKHFEERYYKSDKKAQNLKFLQDLFENPRPKYIDLDNIIGVLNYVTPLLQNFQDQLSESTLIEEVIRDSLII